MDAESDSDDSDSSSGEVTRDNVIDKVESYEGHTLILILTHTKNQKNR